jgi:two-component system OmpR family sensor kinase
VTSQSLRFSLSRSILITALVLSLFSSIIAGWVAFYSAREVQDELLQSVANLVRANQVAVSTYVSGKQDDEEVNIVIRRLAKNTSESRKPYFPEKLKNGFHTVELDHDQWRVLIISHKPDAQRYAIAQQTGLRNELALASSTGVLFPILVMTFALLVLIPMLVSRALKPLRKLSATIQTLPGETLPPLDESAVPSEIAPFINAIGGLLERNRAVLYRQRRFVADAAHELRTPVAAQVILTENLARSSSETERRDRSRQVKQGLDRLQNLVTRLLDLARLQNHDSQQTQPVLVSDVVRSVVGELQPLAVEHGVDVGLVKDVVLHVLDKNETLSQLIRNAIENAIFHSPENGQIDIAITGRESTALITVEDNGPGIDPSELSRVMEPFYRSPTNANPGSGLGLAISQEIAQQLNGKITLENRSVGGLCFRYEQPLFEVSS